MGPSGWARWAVLTGWSNGKFEPVPQIKGTVRTLRQTSDGTLWIGSIGHGLYRYVNGGFSHLTSADLLPSNTILSIFEDAGAAGLDWHPGRYGALEQDTGQRAAVARRFRF